MAGGLLAQVDAHVVTGRQQQRDDDDGLVGGERVEGCRHIRLLHVDVAEPHVTSGSRGGHRIDERRDRGLAGGGGGAVRDREERGGRHPPILLQERSDLETGGAEGIDDVEEGCRLIALRIVDPRRFPARTQKGTTRCRIVPLCQTVSDRVGGETAASAVRPRENPASKPRSYARWADRPERSPCPRPPWWPWWPRW